jgi:hypothetical protein
VEQRKDFLSAVERLEMKKGFCPFIAGPYNRLVGEIMKDRRT